MPTKLTLSINKSVIEKAKSYAKHSGRSLSEIVESYLNKITISQSSKTDTELNKIFGIIKLSDNFDEKKEIRKIRYDKHAK